MTVGELIKELIRLDARLPVQVEDGLDPSDPKDASVLSIEQDRFQHDRQVVVIR